MERCENCGKRNPEPLCASCAHARRKAAQAAAQERRDKFVAPPKPPDRPDVDELKERLRKVEEGLGQ